MLKLLRNSVLGLKNLQRKRFTRKKAQDARKKAQGKSFYIFNDLNLKDTPI
jgi:hypothetical protein